MSIDLSHLGGLNPVEQLSSTDYPVNKEKSFRLAPAGIYTLRAPESFPPEAFSRATSGALVVQIDPTVVEGPFEGTTVKYTKVSAKSFKRDGKDASQVGDYLAACGWQGTIQNEQDIANAIETTAGKVYQSKLDWNARNKRTGYKIQGMAKFPKNPDGSHQGYVIDPAEVDVEASKAAGKLVGKKDPDTGKELRVYANLEVPFGGFIPAVTN